MEIEWRDPNRSKIQTINFFINQTKINSIFFFIAIDEWINNINHLFIIIILTHNSYLDQYFSCQTSIKTFVLDSIRQTPSSENYDKHKININSQHMHAKHNDKHDPNLP